MTHKSEDWKVQNHTELEIYSCMGLFVVRTNRTHAVIEIEI